MTTILSIRGEAGHGSPLVELDGQFDDALIVKIKQFAGCTQPFYLTSHSTPPGVVADKYDSVGEHNTNRTNAEIVEFFKSLKEVAVA